MPGREYYPLYGELPPEERVTQALEVLEQGLNRIFDSESFAAYLTLLSRFHHYSAQNVAMIYLQRPHATQVAGYTRWKELGRQVKKGEKGIKILVPHKRKMATKDEEDERFTISGFGVGTVFDGLSRDLKSYPVMLEGTSHSPLY